MILAPFLVVPVTAAVAALVYGAMWLGMRDSRYGVAYRYPLRLLTWLMAFPAALASAAAVFFGVMFAWPRGETDGTFIYGNSVESLIMPGLGLIGTAVSIAVIILAHGVAALDRRSRPWLIVILSMPPILVVMFVSLLGMAEAEVFGLAGLAFSLGATANALMAVAVASTQRRAPAPAFLTSDTPPASTASPFL